MAVAFSAPWKNALSTALFYAVFAGAVVVTHKISPSGMCGLGYGLLLALLLSICTVMLLVKNYSQWRIREQPTQVSFGIHLAVLLGIGTMLAIARQP